ncbi:uncharacterized protein LOC119723720 isoform X2 [Patiria miniata]|uniref:Uncharacterized protein n=1 Tax=Patiria miniata TaxID=46514 RepID=A0A913ZHE2_PATMI|nr:uncharacterized protein LOC119723720 isoform X2 [Patiria miniata]
MASTRDRHANAVTNKEGSGMEGAGVPQRQGMATRIPAPKWKTTAKCSGTDLPTTKPTTGTHKTGIRPAQVRTNPRVTRQGVRSKADSESSNDSVRSPTVSRTEQDFEGSRTGLRENLSPLSPSTTLTRRGAFRYGRGVKPLEVLNLGSGATTLPRMRPKRGRDPRNLDIFTNPEVFDAPSNEDSGKSQATKKDKQTKGEQPNTSTRKTSQRPQSLGRVSGIRQMFQESAKITKPGVPKAAGPRISKGIKGGTGPEKGVDNKSESKSPEPLPVSNHSQLGAKTDKPRDQKQIKNTMSHSRTSPNKVNSDINPRPTRSVHSEQKTIEMSPKAPPRRQRTLPSSTNGLSSNRTPIPKTYKIPQETSNTVRSPGTPEPPPRHSKHVSAGSASPRAIPTNIPRPQSLKRRVSYQPGPTQATLSPRHSLPANTRTRLSNKSSLSFPQGTKSLSPIDAVKNHEERQRSHSASQIPLPISRRSSLPQYRQVKLRHKVPQSDRPSPIFRLSLDGADSGTEYSSSLTTTPSECSIDIDQSYEEGSPVCQTTPSRFYSISGLDMAKVQDDSSTENLQKMPFQDTETTPDDVSKEIKQTSNLPAESGECLLHARHREETLTHEATLTQEASPITDIVPKDKETNPAEFGFDGDGSTTPKNETSDTTTSERELLENEAPPSKTCKSDSLGNTKQTDQQNSTYPIERVDPSQSTDSSKCVEGDESVCHTTQSISDSERNLKTFLRTEETVRSVERTEICPRSKSDTEHPKAIGFAQSRMGREIALRVARGDLKASSVDGDGETLCEVASTGENLSEPHEVPSAESSVPTHNTKATVEGTTCISGDQESTVGPQNSRRRRKISSIESPHKALASTGDILRDAQSSDNPAIISGSMILEKMMDTEEAVPRPNHRKNSFHPYAKEKSEVEQRYLQSCSDPIKLLEFLMNVDDPPKVKGQRGERTEPVLVKRRAKSDVQSPSQRRGSTDNQEVSRWSMPSALEQWSQNFWAQLTSTGRSRQGSRTKELDVTGVSDGRVPVTPEMPSANSKTNLTPDKRDRIQGVESQTLLSSERKDSRETSHPNARRQWRKHRWSIPVETGSLPPSIGGTDPIKNVAEPSPESNKIAEPTLKRKSWWRWSFPVPRQKSSRSSLYVKNPNSETLKQDPVASQNSKETHQLPSSQGNKQLAKSAPSVPSRKSGKRAPSFSDIADTSTSSPSPVKIFVDSSYAEQNNGFCHPKPSRDAGLSSIVTDDQQLLNVSADQVPVSTETETASDDAAISSAVRGDQSSASSGPQFKKRLSWKRDKSLEMVCYLERRDSGELTGSEDECISDEEECNENESLSPLSPLEFIPEYQSKIDDAYDDYDDENQDANVPYVLTDHNEELSRASKTASVPTFSAWVLPSDELKSKLESVYAERQKSESDDAGGDVWKLDPNARNSFQSGSAGQEEDLGASPSIYHPESSMRDAVVMSMGIGKRLSLKQRLSIDQDSDLNENTETMGRQSRDSIKEVYSGSRSPTLSILANNNRPKLSRQRSGSGSDSVKDNRRKLDDVSHKSRLRIERDREIKSSVSPSSPAINETSQNTPPKSRKSGQSLTVPVETEINGEQDKEKDTDASVGESLQAFRRRKKSMAIALSEGLLDLQEEHAASLEKTSELQMVSHISQLNQELMQLTQHSPPGTPPIPNYHRRGSLKRSGSRSSLASLPGSATSPRSFPGIRLWKSIAQFQTTSDDPAIVADEPSSNVPSPEKDRSSTLPAPKKTSLKDDEDPKEKTVSPKLLLSRIKQWSKKKGQAKPKARPEIVKLDPKELPEDHGKTDREEKEDKEDDSSTPTKGSLEHLPDYVNIRNNSPKLPHKPLVAFRPVPMSRDTALRQTWHGMPSRKTNGNDDDRDEDRLGGSNFQRSNSLRHPIRQRKRGVSPMENAHLVAMHLSTETIPGSSVDSGIVKDRGTEETYLAGDSDTSSSNLCSPCSSLGGSNPPSRPLSSDIVDLQWEKGSVEGQAMANGGLTEERKLSAVTIGRRESGTGIAKSSRRPMVSRLSISLSSQPPNAASPDTPEAITSPKKVTFSLAEDITKKAVEEDLKRLPKPLHLPRRIKTDPGDTRTIACVVKEVEDEQRDASSQPRPPLRRRAQSELSSIHERSWDDDIKAQPPAVKEEADKSEKGTLARPKSIPDHMSLLEGEGAEMLPRKNSLADLIGSEVGEVLSTFGNQYNFEAYSPDTMPTFAEALWDHVTMDESELAFKAGDVIEVTDMRDKNWWWGCRDEVEGWVPAQFVRLRVSQGETVEECMERLREEREQSNKTLTAKKNRKVSLSFLSNEQVRAKVVEEIITTERDYVRHLHDVCEGYISQALDRPEMFSEEVVNTLFGNIEEIYSFQKGFLLQLEATIIQDRPQLTRIGGCFLEHKSGFETYSEYCNNYPNALRELKQLREKQKYGQFFEACRLLQNMIEINLEGFLLTPVQKICKYPLQLRELLKYTRPQHADYQELQEALEVMKDVALTINDRKRRIENIEKIAAWQKAIGDWEGEDLLEKSTQLIHSGEITMLAGKRWTSGRRAFLFDHQLVVCKKDWKGTLLYKKRIDLDVSEVADMPDGKDLQWSVTVKHAFKIHDTQLNKLHIFSCKGDSEKQEWLKMLAKERESVMKDREKGFSIPTAIREAAMKNVMGDQPSKPQDVAVVTRKVSEMPYAYQHKILKAPNKKVPLSKGISSTDVFKKKGKGLFGIGKK